MRRVAVVALVALMSFPATARADDDLAGVLESAMDAEFHGTGVVMGIWGADSAATTYDVTRSEGMSMVSSPVGGLMVSGGLLASQSGTDWYALEVGEWSKWSLSDRYSLAEPIATTRLGRPATAVIVMEGDLVRARLVIDDESTVPLLTEVFDGEGLVFRFAALLEFEPGPSPAMDMPDEFMERTVLMHGEDSPRLPGSVAGYARTDTYVTDGSATQAFYSDGLFSFSVFEAGRGMRPAEFGSGTRFEVGGYAYERVVTPGNVWVHWSTPEHSYVLAGDLPPDHIEQVLDGLPRPGMRGVVTRILLGLFG